MKSCGYCGRESDDGAVFCLECGTPFPGRSADPAEAPWGFPALPQVPRPVAAGLAVMLVFAGVVVASRKALPVLYALTFTALPWGLLLATGSLVLVLHTGRLCCRALWHRVLFTLAVLAALFLEGSVLLPGETGLGSHGSRTTVYGASALLILAGVLILARMARRNRQQGPSGVPPVAPQMDSLAASAGDSGTTKPPPPAS